jgi:hypothetical protein
VLFLLHATTPAIALEPRCTHMARRVRTEGRDEGKKLKELTLSKLPTEVQTIVA